MAASIDIAANYFFKVNQKEKTLKQNYQKILRIYGNSLLEFR